MSYIFFEDVLEELGHKLIYDAIVNYAGNSMCEKSWEMISERNPFYIKSDKKDGTQKTLANFFSSADVKVRKTKRKKGD